MAAGRKSRPTWMDTAGRQIGLLAKFASLIEMLRRLI
jgi:hypothetical protein